MDFNKIVQEWFFRLPKGYAHEPYSIDEIRVLHDVLHDFGLSMPAGSIQLTEASPKQKNVEAETPLSKRLANTAKAYKKEKQLAFFISNLPGGLSRKAIIEFLNSLSKTQLTEFITKLHSKNKVSSVTSSDITGVGALLFELNPEGVGKGEFFLSWLLRGAVVSGGSKSYDITINGSHYEVKDYRTGDAAGIRLGTKGKVTRFKFWGELNRTLDFLVALQEEDPELETLKDAKELAKKLVARADFIRGGECNTTDMKDFRELFAKLSAIFQSTATGYTAVTFRGPNIPPAKFTIKEIPRGITTGKTSINILSSELDDVTDALVLSARKLLYVREPQRLDSDIQNAVDTLVDDLPFIIFRKRKINITTEFVFKKISQGTIYIIEKSLAGSSDEGD